MEKSFDEITVSSLSDLQLGSSSGGAGVTADRDYEPHQSQSPFHREPISQQRNSSSSNGNENNLNRLKRSPKQQQQPRQPTFNPSKHLDVWLANAIRGLESSSGQDSSDQLDSPTLKGGFGEPLSLPPNLGYLDVLNSSASTTGPFSPTQQQLQQQHQPSQEQSPVSGIIHQQQQQQFLQSQYRFGNTLIASEGTEFASLPPRISHHHSQQPQYQHARRPGAPGQQNQSFSFQDLLNSQRIMTDPYVNDSSDNESKNSCAKSKLETAEALLADLNLLNSSTVATNNGTVLPGVGNANGNGLNGTSTGNNSSANNNSSNSNNNLVLVLLKEIGKLHETNKKICRNLHETKVEMEALKHAPHWGLSHRRDSISGLSTNSQPVGMRYNSFGLQSPAPTYHSQGNYTPGIVSDVVREIREVSRVREEALMDRMKTMIEERSWALNEANFRLMKDSDEMKKSIHAVRSDMNQVMDRMLKLENEVITLKSQLSHYQQQQHQQHNFVTLRERDSYGQGAGTAASKLRRSSLHLNYGRINSTDEFYGNNFNDMSNELRFGNGGSGVRTNSSNKFGENNFGSSLNGGGGFVLGEEEVHEDSSNDQVLLLEKDALKLRRELQDALASKQESENRITALENIVSTLKEQVPPATVVMSSQHHHGTHLLQHHLQQQPSQPLTTSAGLGTSGGGSSGGMLLTTTQQQQQRTQSPNPYYFRSNNSASPSGTGLQQHQHQHPPAAVSPKLQKAAQIQCLASPSKQQPQQHYGHHVPSGGTINVSGPVTDL